MGWLSRAFNITPQQVGAALVQPWQDGKAQLSDAKYLTYATEGYQKNELVFACIEELSTSAAEPRMMLRRQRSEEWIHEGHRLLALLERPNPFMDRYEFWATVIMHRSLAGNAYALIARSTTGVPLELWLLRPDRVRIVPSRSDYIQRYEYDAGNGQIVPLPVEDVIHFRTRNPINEWYGQPPLMAAAGRIDIDNYMKDLVKTAFQRRGVPAAVLASKNKLPDDLKKEIKDRLAGFAGPAGWHGTLVLDQTEATYTPITMNFGASGLVIPELDAISEARIAMVFQVPLGLVGAKLGMNSSSYANRKSDRESFWDETLSPLYKSLQGPINLRLTPNFPDVREVAFDLSDVRALQEDIDKVHARERANLMSGGITIEEFRAATGRLEAATTGTYLIPGNMVPVPAQLVAGDPTALVEHFAPTPPALPSGESEEGAE